MGLIGFGIAQVVSSVMMLGGFVVCFRGLIASHRITFDSMSDLLPSPSPLSPTGRSLKRLIVQFSLQSIEKLILTEGEKIVLKTTESLLNLAIFSVASNLGILLLIICILIHIIAYQPISHLMTLRRIIGSAVSVPAH